MTLGDFVEGPYARWCVDTMKPASALHTLWRLRSRWAPLLKCELKDLRPREVIELRARRRRRDGINPGTANRDLAALKACVRKAYDMEYLDTLPLQRVKLLSWEPEVIGLYIEPDQERVLRQALLERGAADQLRVAVLVTMNTGMRWGELAELRWQDVDFRARLLTVRASIAKSKKARRVPLNSEAQQLLTLWKRASSTKVIPAARDRVFPGRDGGRLSPLRGALHTLQLANGLPKTRWHDLRHHFASRLVIAGTPIERVQDLLGHADIKTTRIYSHLAPKHMREDIERISGQWEDE